MLDKDTPPQSPKMRASFSSDDEMMEEDMYEVIDIEEGNSESENLSDDEDDRDLPMDIAEEASSQNDDAVYVFRGHAQKYSVFCCSLSKNGELAATGSEEDKAYLWNTITGDIILECTGHKDSIIFAEFSFNDTYLATADMSGIIKLWRIDTKACIWETNLGDIAWIKWHKSAIVLLVGLNTGEVHMLKVPEGICKIFAQGYGDQSETGIFLSDGKHAAIGYQSGTIRVINLRTSAIVSTVACNPIQLCGHSSAITALDCYIDNNLLISTSINGKTILSTANNGKIVSVLQDLNSNPVESSTEDDDASKVSVEVAAFCKDPTFPVAATGTIEKNSNGKIYIWDISRQALRHQIHQEEGITKLIWINTILFTAGLDGILRCFDAKAGCCLRLFLGHKAVILDLCISTDKKKALTVSDDATARIFDISSIS